MKSSVKSRSIQLARCLTNAGLKPGDVVAVSGVNHLNAHIPFYAGYLNGLPITGIDPFYVYEEVKVVLNITKPKLAFCEASKLADYERAARDLGLDTRIVTFGASDRSYADFVKTYDDHAPETEFSCFRVANFDTEKVYAWLISTSGTTGMPKVAAIKHSEVLKVVKLGALVKQKERVPVLNLSSTHWITTYMSTLCNIASAQHNVQTSSPHTVEHIIDIINKYKPAMLTSSPLLFVNILRHEKYCDLTCFSRIVISGFHMKPEIFKQLKARMRPDTIIWNLLAQTECVGSILMPAPHGPPGNCGQELPSVIPVQLRDPQTGEVITEPNRTGELCTKGPRFTEYYNNPEATAAAFTPDGWYKTGDLLYRDEEGFFFYVERMTSSFRYRNYFVTPLELELLIQEHPGVLDVCVVGVPHPEDGKQAVACVQTRPGFTLTEQEVKDIVAELELLIQEHPGVLDVCVVGVPHPEDGKQAVACVQTRPGFTLTEQDVKDIVAELELLIQEHPGVLDVCVVGMPHPEDGKQAVACVQTRPGFTLTEQEVTPLELELLIQEHPGVLDVCVVGVPHPEDGKQAVASHL
ncbi:luciferin 4-monooxygenase-like [Cydia fagiglandana]|uniref:luciferin 4-monooxygenase-like n=1 Tax=Cydia fagiglandana TaxID=1458189 RepID=UPI002FEDE797